MAIGEKLINSKDLIAESFSLIKKDKSLLIPPILSFVTIAISAPLLFFFVIIPSLLFGKAVYLAGALTLLALYFIATLFNAALTWMIYEAKKGKDTTMASGLKKAFKEFFDVLMFSVVSLIISIIASAIRGKREERNFLRDLLADTVAGAWALIGQLILPAMILTDKNFFQAWTEIKEYRTTIPQLLVGQYGLGFIFGLILFLAILITIGAFFVSPVLGLIALIGTFGIILFNYLIKTIFFTLLYIQIKKL